MPAELTILGIRHHGPGSARMVVRALQQLRPDAVLIEGPPDAAEVISLAGHVAMKPPIALLVYEPDKPSNASYYPFAEFSPEWQAIRWGLHAGAKVRFIDLPWALRNQADEADAATDETGEPPAANPTPTFSDKQETQLRDPLEALALAAGFTDGEAWWGRLIEERRGADDPVGLFHAICEAMASMRDELGPTSHEPDEPAREAHMRKSIRAAVKEGFERIVVVCGAWHAPVLTSAALKEHSAKSDDDLLKGLSKRKTTATWIPWTYDRLSMFSGYGAGIVSPGWYEHLWVHHEQVSERWLTRVARLLRDEDLDAALASIIESVRLADSLATLRGRSITGLDELGEATIAILCHGNPLQMQVIEDKLIIGERLGEVPEDAPAVPLQRDLTSLQKSLRMKVSAVETILDLDQRKENDLARSRLLHRLTILDIDWGRVEADQRQRVSTFHEVWMIQWRPELAVAVIEAARWGNTVHDAAAAYVADRADNTTDLAELTGMLDHVMLADLPSAVERLVDRIKQVSSVSSDVGHLMDALRPLALVLRYGDVRKTDAALVEPVVGGLLARICAGLLPACASLDDDCSGMMRDRIDGLHEMLATLDRPLFMDDWKELLRKAGDADIHSLVVGRCWRLLLDTLGATPDETASRLSLGLSPGNDPAKASAWLEGFLAGSGMVLIHDSRLLGIVDQWVGSLSREIFEQVCPIGRRTFSTFQKPERRQIGEKLTHGISVGNVAPAATAIFDDYNPVRGALVEPVLRLILGDRFA